MISKNLYWDIFCLSCVWVQAKAWIPRGLESMFSAMAAPLTPFLHKYPPVLSEKHYIYRRRWNFHMVTHNNFFSESGKINADFWQTDYQWNPMHERVSLKFIQLVNILWNPFSLHKRAFQSHPSMVFTNFWPIVFVFALMGTIIFCHS